MNEVSKIEKPEGLELLRQPFEPHQISKLPKPTKKQTDIVKEDYTKGVRCKVCGGWHHPDVIHLDYVGHAALTNRLLDVDPNWFWEPLATFENGAPAFDEIGGLWIKLHILGHARIGYGCADGKQGGDAKKEVIGDALRNAAMRFGAALDLWHKGDLIIEDPEPKEPANTNNELPPLKGPLQRTALAQQVRNFQSAFMNAETLEEFLKIEDDYKAVTDQAKAEMIELLTTSPEEGSPTLASLYKKKLAELQAKEEQMEQMADDLRAPE